MIVNATETLLFVTTKEYLLRKRIRAYRSNPIQAMVYPDV